MMHLHSDSHMQFDFEGQFLGFMSRDGKLNYLRLRVSSEEMQIKIPKTVWATLGLSPQVGEAIQVTGIGKFNHQTQAVKLKATQVMLLTEHDIALVPSPNLEADTTQAFHTAKIKSKIKPKIKPKIKVLLCQKSGCLKRGGKELYERLDQALCDRNLKQEVTIERTGCLKCCSTAPSLVIMPGNLRYSKVRPKMLPQIADAIAQHLTRVTKD